MSNDSTLRLEDALTALIQRIPGADQVLRDIATSAPGATRVRWYSAWDTVAYAFDGVTGLLTNRQEAREAFGQQRGSNDPVFGRLDDSLSNLSKAGQVQGFFMVAGITIVPWIWTAAALTATGLTDGQNAIATIAQNTALALRVSDSDYQPLCVASEALDAGYDSAVGAVGSQANRNPYFARPLNFNSNGLNGDTFKVRLQTNANADLWEGPLAPDPDTRNLVVAFKVRLDGFLFSGYPG